MAPECLPNSNKKRNSMPEEYVIGLDGGGAKTTAILADLNGKILARAKTGSSHPRYLGLERAAESAAFVIEKVLKKAGKNARISFSFLGLPAMEEEMKFGKNLVRKELMKHKRILKIFKGKVVIGSDQLAGFRCGTDEKDGIVLIGGSGYTCHGWYRGKEAKIDGWGYLSEMGSAFFVGQQALRTVFKEFDGRKKKSLLSKFVLRGLKVKNKEQLISLVYSSSPMEIIPSLSAYCNQAAERGEGSAKDILAGAGREMALSAITAISKLNFGKKKFPLVLIGSMFNSNIVLNSVKKEIEKFSPKAEIIRPEAEPVWGAVKLALDMAMDETIKKLRGGEVIICPTDTVYGLIASVTNKKAVNRVFRIKGRSKNKSFPVFVSNLAAAKQVAIMGEKQGRFLKKVWPGKITAVLKKKPGLKIYGTEGKTIALRVPKYKLVNSLLDRAGFPLVGTSANISGKPATTQIKKVMEQFRGRIFQPDAVIDVGNLRPSRPSKVVDLTDKKPKILRK